MSDGTTLLCLSDTHIGAGYEHRREALADTEKVLDQIVDLAVENKADLVLHGGDVFHRSKPSPAELHVFKRFCSRLEQARIPMIAITGNGAHEASQDDKSALELFESAWVRISRRPERITEWAGVSVVTLPAAPLGRLVAQGGTDRGEACELAVDLLLQTARELFDACDPEKPRILLGHWPVSGGSLPTGLPVESLSGPVLPLPILEEIPFDVMLFGDIHVASELSPLAIVSIGSPMVHDFGEASERHGVWLVEIDYSPNPESPSYTGLEFKPLEDRRFVTVDVDLTLSGDQLKPYGDLVDETDFVSGAIANHLPLTDSILRVRYTATEDQHRRVDTKALDRLIQSSGVHRLYGGYQWIPVRENRARVAELDENLSPLSALDLWLEAQGVSGAEGEALRVLTERLLGTLT